MSSAENSWNKSKTQKWIRKFRLVYYYYFIVRPPSQTEEIQNIIYDICVTEWKISNLTKALLWNNFVFENGMYFSFVQHALKVPFFTDSECLYRFGLLNFDDHLSCQRVPMSDAVLFYCSLVPSRLQCQEREMGASHI